MHAEQASSLLQNVSNVHPASLQHRCRLLDRDLPLVGPACWGPIKGLSGGGPANPGPRVPLVRHVRRDAAQAMTDVAVSLYSFVDVYHLVTALAPGLREMRAEAVEVWQLEPGGSGRDDCASDSDGGADLPAGRPGSLPAE